MIGDSEAGLGEVDGLADGIGVVGRGIGLGDGDGVAEGHGEVGLIGESFVGVGDGVEEGIGFGDRECTIGRVGLRVDVVKGLVGLERGIEHWLGGGTGAVGNPVRVGEGIREGFGFGISQLSSSIGGVFCHILVFEFDVGSGYRLGDGGGRGELEGVVLGEGLGNREVLAPGS